MRCRNPPSRNRRRKAGPPPWPSATVIEQWRSLFVECRGLPPDASPEAVEALERADAWVGGVDMTWAPAWEVMRRVWTWAYGPLDAAGRRF